MTESKRRPPRRTPAAQSRTEALTTQLGDFLTSAEKQSANAASAATWRQVEHEELGQRFTEHWIDAPGIGRMSITPTAGGYIGRVNGARIVTTHTLNDAKLALAEYVQTARRIGLVAKPSGNVVLRRKLLQHAHEQWEAIARLLHQSEAERELALLYAAEARAMLGELNGETA